MVKFGKYLETHCVPEWSTQYVHYKQLKKKLKKIRAAYNDAGQYERGSRNSRTTGRQYSLKTPRAGQVPAQTFQPPPPLVDAQGQTTDVQNHHDDELPTEVEEAMQVSNETALQTSTLQPTTGTPPRPSPSPPPDARRSISNNAALNTRLTGFSTNSSALSDHASNHHITAGAQYVQPPQIMLPHIAQLPNNTSSHTNGVHVSGDSPAKPTATEAMNDGLEADQQPATPPKPVNTRLHHHNGLNVNGVTEHSIDVKTGYHTKLGYEPYQPPAFTSFLPPADNGMIAYDQEQQFFLLLDIDLQTVDHFHLMQEDWFAQKYELLEEQARQLVGTKKSLQSQKQRQSLEKALKELYRGLYLLKNYRILNYTAFVKILKKHDKISLEFPDATQQCVPHIQLCAFFHSPLLERLISKTEQLYVNQFFGGSRKRAMDSLRVTPQRTSLWTSCEFGLAMGICICLLVVLGIELAYIGSNDISLHGYLNDAVPIWRFLGLVLEAVWLWGCCVYFYNRLHINYEFIFELDPRYQLTHVHILMAAAAFSVMYLVALVVYIFALISTSTGTWNTNTFDPQYIHLILFCVVIGVIVFPFNVAFFRTRVLLLKTLLSVITAPFSTTGFKEMFVGDQLTSLVVPIVDLSFIMCWYTTSDFLGDHVGRCNRAVNQQAIYVIALLPYFWRFLQCIRRAYETGNRRNTANAGKYLSSMLNTAFNYLQSSYSSQPVFKGWWIAFAVIATCYTAFWDLHYDWGLIRHVDNAEVRNAVYNGYGMKLDTMATADPTMTARRPDGNIAHEQVNQQNGTETATAAKPVRWWQFWRKYRFIRAHTLIPYPAWYYTTAVLDICLRVTWVFTISPNEYAGFLTSVHVRTITGALEVFRRAIWNCNRLEFEQLANTEAWRVVNIVPLKFPAEPKHLSRKKSSKRLASKADPTSRHDEADDDDDHSDHEHDEYDLTASDDATALNPELKRHISEHHSAYNLRQLGVVIDDSDEDDERPESMRDVLFGQQILNSNPFIDTLRRATSASTRSPPLNSQRSRPPATSTSSPPLSNQAGRRTRFSFGEGTIADMNKEKGILSSTATDQQYYDTDSQQPTPSTLRQRTTSSNGDTHQTNGVVPTATSPKSLVSSTVS